jgi:hypothetical protein
VFAGALRGDVGGREQRGAGVYGEVALGADLARWADGDGGAAGVPVSGRSTVATDARVFRAVLEHQALYRRGGDRVEIGLRAGLQPETVGRALARLADIGLVVRGADGRTWEATDESG